MRRLCVGEGEECFGESQIQGNFKASSEEIIVLYVCAFLLSPNLLPLFAFGQTTHKFDDSAKIECF